MKNKRGGSMNQLCNGTSVQTTFSHLSPPYRSLSAFTRTPFTPTINTQSDRLAACGRAHTFGPTSIPETPKHKKATTVMAHLMMTYMTRQLPAKPTTNTTE